MAESFICIYMRKAWAESMNISFRHILLQGGLRMIWVKTMSTSEFKFYCSHCDQPLKCDPCHAGRQIQCPGCQHLIRIPSPRAGTGFTRVEPQSGQTWDTFVPKGKKG